jgi:Na+-transporting NADH:ubiquinone oxidoreductase subunit NqrB
VHVIRQQDWVRDAIERSSEEVRSYVGAGVAVTLRPARFAADWVEGRQRALNPLGMLATGAAVLSTARALLDVVVGRSSAAQGLLEAIRDGVAPFAHYLVLGAICHVLLVAMTRSGRRLTDSLAMSLFAGGGPGVASALIVYVAGALLWMVSGRPDVVRNGLLGSLPPAAAGPLLWIAYAGYALFLGSLLLSLASLHRAPRWKTALALALGVVAVGVLFGLKPGDVTFGTRVLVRFHPLRASVWVD